eukprot:Skav201417  [mRNA]  locus=scaffold4849:55991:60745:+ [translate_table: standard]
MARLLLLHGADVFAHFSVDGWTALHSACHGGHDHIAKLLVEEDLWWDGIAVGVDATATRAGYVNWTPLHLAAVRGYTEILQVLLKAKAANPFEVTGEFYVSSVQLNRLAAGDENAVTCVQKVVPTGASKDELDQGTAALRWFDGGLTPLHLSAFGGHLRTLRTLLRRSGRSQGNINVLTQTCRGQQR